MASNPIPNPYESGPPAFHLGPTVNYFSLTGPEMLLLFGWRPGMDTEKIVARIDDWRGLEADVVAS
jgi:hypothetical protein